jgi:tetratricopeptide (TPR) repeat protein
MGRFKGFFPVRREGNYVEVRKETRKDRIQGYKDKFSRLDKSISHLIERLDMLGYSKWIDDNGSRTKYEEIKQNIESKLKGVLEGKDSIFHRYAIFDNKSHRRRNEREGMLKREIDNNLQNLYHELADKCQSICIEAKEKLKSENKIYMDVMEKIEKIEKRRYSMKKEKRRFADSARNHYKKGQYEEAIYDCTRWLVLDKENANALINRSKAKKALGDYKGAKDDLKKARSKQSWDEHAYATYGHIAMDSSQSKGQNRQNRQNSALYDYIPNSESVDSKSPEDLNKENEVYKDLIDELDSQTRQKVIKEFYKSAKKHYKKKQPENFEDVVTDCDRVLVLDKNHAMALELRGAANLRLSECLNVSRDEKLRDALEDLSKALEIGSSVRAYGFRGMVYGVMASGTKDGQQKQQELYCQAWEDFNQALKIDSSQNLAKEHRKKVEEKINDDMREKVIQGYLDNGQYYLENGLYKEAEDSCTRVIELSGGNTSVALNVSEVSTEIICAYAYRGVAYYRMGQYKKAWEDFNQVSKCHNKPHWFDKAFEELNERMN